MGETILNIVLCLMIPVLLLLFYLEKRARRIIVSFLAGVLSCIGAYFANSLIFELAGGSMELLSNLLGPLCEELLKLIPILIIALIVNKGKRGSVANAYAVGIGFCVVENFFYLASAVDSPVPEVVSRGLGTGLMHGMSAIILGLGIFYSRKRKGRAVPAIMLTFAAAAAYHCLFNFLVQGSTAMRIIGLLIPPVTYVVLFLVVKREDVKRFFSEE